MMLTMRASRPLEIPRHGGAAALRARSGAAVAAGAARDRREVGWGVALDILALNDVVFEKLARDRQASVAVYVDRTCSRPTRRTRSSSPPDRVHGVQLRRRWTDPVAAAGRAGFHPGRAAHGVQPQPGALRDERVAVRVLDHSGQVAVSVDGQLRGCSIPATGSRVYAGPHRARLVRLGDAAFLDRVRSRFGLADARAGPGRR